MTNEQAHSELTALRGLIDGGADLASLRGRIDALYFAVCGKHLRKCNCKNVEMDAIVEIHRKLKMYESKKIDMTQAQARLVNGVVLQWKGNHYTNSNLTDEVAREFLAAFPVRKDWFAVLPPTEEPKAEVSEEQPAKAPTTKSTKKKGKRK
jgi:hypothetical protein